MADGDGEPGEQPDNSNKPPAEGEGSSSTGAWLSGLETDNQEFAKSKGWEKLSGDEAAREIFTSYSELQKSVGSKITVPADDAPDEVKEKFYTAIGRPEKPEGYEFKLPEDYPEGIPYDKEFAEDFKGEFHKAGVPAKAAEHLHGVFALKMAKMAQAQVEQVAKSVEETHDALVKDWGPQDSEKFKANLASMNKALDKLGLTDVFKAYGLMLDDGTITNAAIAQAAKTVGEAMFREDDLEGDGEKGGSSGRKNPWKADQLDTQEQNRRIRAAKDGTKADRTRVARQIEAAGKNPAQFFEEGSY